MNRLVFDIETIGENFNELDKTTQHSLTSWIKKEARDEDDYRKMLEDVKNGLGFSALTGEIVVLGVLDYAKNSGVVYFQAPDKKVSEFTIGKFKFKQATEKEMLDKFWQGVKNYEEFISFNGRGFDVPFILARSAKYEIRATKDLMSNRYLGMQKFGAKHIDLLDQLTFYGAVRRRGNLHLWCRLFNIKSPKAEGVTGDDVQKLFENKEYEKIAEYNSWDLEATKELYNYWKNYIQF